MNCLVISAYECDFRGGFLHYSYYMSTGMFWSSILSQPQGYEENIRCYSNCQDGNDIEIDAD